MLKKRPPLVIVDESNKYIQPRPAKLPFGLAELNDTSRHYGVAWGVICRRPTQIHSDVLELAHYHFYFRMPGPRDTKMLNNIHPGMGDECRSLPDYYFIVYEQGLGYYVHNPIEMKSLGG